MITEDLYCSIYKGRLLDSVFGLSSRTLSPSQKPHLASLVVCQELLLRSIRDSVPWQKMAFEVCGSLP